MEEIAQNSAAPRAGHGRRSACARSSTARRRSPPTTSSASARPTVAGFFVAAGFCAHGIAGAGGIGKVMAEWIVAGEPEFDVWHMDVNRFGRQYRSPGYTLARTVENYRTYYDIPYPDRQRDVRAAAAACPPRTPGTRRTAPTSARSPAGSASTTTRPTRRAATTRCARTAGPAATGRPRSGAEHRATRETAGLFDESSFAKIEVSGPDAARPARVGLRQPRRPGHRRRDLHAGAQPPRRHRVRLHRDPHRRRRLPRRHGHGVRHRTTWRGCASRPVGAARTCGSPTSPGSSPASRCGGRTRATSSARLTAGRPRQRGVPVHDLAGAHGRRRPGAAHCG